MQKKIYNFAPSMRCSSNIIGVNYAGRLGNQMFTYAFVRKVIEKRALKNHTVIANFTRSLDGDIDHGFTDSLCHFNVMPYCKTKEDLVARYGNFLQRMIFVCYAIISRIKWLMEIDSFETWLFHWLESYDIYQCAPADKARQIKETLCKYNVFVSGLFQDSKNFSEIRNILLEEFTPRYPALVQNSKLYEAAASEGSVCISVRCGDYLSTQYKKDFYVCGPDYFTEAIKLMTARVKNPVFIFFSDDIEWVKKNISVSEVPCYYESGQDPVWEKLRLMYSCHHFIISNSTFSWWAQYLGRRDDKIVISPSRWYAKSEWHSCLIEDSFILVNKGTDGK